jgi:hypothetical protein
MEKLANTTTTRVEIKDPEQAKLLTDPESFRYFGPFLARDCTVSQAAKEVGCNVDMMLYRVKTFVEAGLLKVVATEHRRGRPIKVYRSSADAYFVLFAATPFEDFESSIKLQNQKDGEIIARGLAKAIRELERDGRHIFRDPHGEVSIHSGSNAADIVLDLDNIPEVARRVYAKKRFIGERTTDELELTDDEAKEFMLEFYKLWRGYKNKKASKGKKKYFLQFSFVPLDE